MDTITIMVCRQKDVNDVKASPGKRPVQCAIQCFAIRTEMLWHFRIVRDQLVQEISIACDDRERIYYRECPGITGRAWNAEWKIQEGFQLLKLFFMGKISAYSTDRILSEEKPNEQNYQHRGQRVADATGMTAVRFCRAKLDNVQKRVLTVDNVTFSCHQDITSRQM